MLSSTVAAVKLSLLKRGSTKLPFSILRLITRALNENVSPPGAIHFLLFPLKFEILIKTSRQLKQLKGKTLKIQV